MEASASGGTRDATGSSQKKNLEGKEKTSETEDVVDEDGQDMEEDAEEEEGDEEDAEEGNAETGDGVAGPSDASSKHKIRKLAPPRPYPTVPTSVSATGPRSAHTEGKNYICITRKTPLGAYLRRCKDVMMKDGYKTLHLNAMGAAIPHLLQLSVSLPSILPHPLEDIHTEVLTGTVEVQDEIIPEDEDEDISYRTRGKSTLSIVIKIGDGVDEVLKQTKNKNKGRNANRFANKAAPKPPGKQVKGTKKDGAFNGPQKIVVREVDMDDS
ncbi:hypothetical protein EUX98_g2322 [Antrodiella citrinella]|uniref:Uncharacterized protein n=1 Tax=Antrodiella citrinella TaxID=2447956 RepID=A0A4S4N0S5_9APHY|nr:hypothetical protein EUX98_g2322 [Antrodiella citrinella]